MVSKRRNEVIAELFHRIHFVEKWGRGISLILSKEPTADFKEVADIFITTFKRKNYDADSNDSDISEKASKKTNKQTSKKTREENSKKTSRETEKETETNKKTSKKTSEKTSKKTSKKIEDQIVDLIKKNSRISVKDLSKLVELSTGGVRYHLDNLKKQGILKRVGPDRGGYWEIMNGKLNASP